jgi:N-acetylglutamate synthase-like GNAT family acetyltransferase
MIIESIEFNGYVEKLLAQENLPVSDLYDSKPVKLFGAKVNNELVGIIGLELFENVALLRSLVVSKELRNRSCGRQLVSIAEACALDKNISKVYLLTTTAAVFFSKLGYKEVSRDSAPSDIASTSQFSDLCPSSATFMSKRLA